MITTENLDKEDILFLESVFTRVEKYDIQLWWSYVHVS